VLLEPSVDTLLVEVMVTGSEGSDLLSSLELTHTHHTTLVVSVFLAMSS
jgi:hypothetical protein